MSVIGNSLNSLPLTYAPLNSTGRYVAYAISAPAVSVGLTPLPHYIGDPSLVLNGGLAVQPQALRNAPSGASLQVSAPEAFVPGMLMAAGGLTAAGALTAAAEPTKTKATAIADLSFVTGADCSPYRIRHCACDFTSLYAMPGGRSSGDVVNGFALNQGALNAKAGQHRQVFEVLCNANASYIADPQCALEEIGSDGLSAGSAICDGSFSSTVTAASMVAPNVIFGPDISLDAVLTAVLAGGCFHSTASLAAALQASLSPLANYIADGAYRWLRSFGPALDSFALNSVPINSLRGPHLRAIESRLVALGSYIASPPALLPAMLGAVPTPNALFVTKSSCPSFSEADIAPNALWGGSVLLATDGLAVPLGNAVTDTSSDMGPVVADAVVLGSLLAGGASAVDCVVDLAGRGSAIFDPFKILTGIPGSTCLGSYIAGGGFLGGALVNHQFVPLRCRVGQTAILVPISGGDVLGNVYFDGGASFGVPGASAADVDGVRCRVASALIGVPGWDYMSGQATVVAVGWEPFYGIISTVYAPAFDDTSGSVYEKSIVLSPGRVLQINPMLATLNSSALSGRPFNGLNMAQASDIDEMAAIETIISHSIPTSVVWGGEDL